MINEVALIDEVLRLRQKGCSDEYIRSVLLMDLSVKLDELLPLSRRMLQGWRDAVEIHNGSQSKANPQTAK